MASKRGTKRTVEPTGEAKKLQDALRQHGIAKKNYEAVVDTINHPLTTGLTDTCRKMLIAMLPNGLCIAAAERNDTQNLTIKMLDEVFENVRSAMQAKVDAEVDKFAPFESSKARLEKAAIDATASLAASAELVTTCQAALASAETAVVTATSNVADKELCQKQEAGKIEEIKMEKPLVESTLLDDFRVLREGTVEGDLAKVHYDKVEALCNKLAVGDSLMNGLPSVLAKKPSERGSFDAMIVSQVEEALSKKLSELSTAIDQHASRADALASATLAATSELEASKATRDSASNALSAAMDSRQQHEEANQVALTAVADYEPEFNTAADVLAGEKEQLKSFVDWNLACFEILRNRQVYVQAEKKQKTAGAGDLEVAAVQAADAGA